MKRLVGILDGGDGSNLLVFCFLVFFFFFPARYNVV